jgi:hypothetical protein
MNRQPVRRLPLRVFVCNRGPPNPVFLDFNGVIPGAPAFLPVPNTVLREAVHEVHTLSEHDELWRGCTSESWSE